MNIFEFMNLSILFSFIGPLVIIVLLGLILEKLTTIIYILSEQEKNYND